MSDYIARAAMERMNLREVAVAAHHNTLATDLRELASTDTESAQEKFLARRAELCAAYGFGPAEQRKPFAFAAGVAIIPVNGSLINRFGGSWGYVTGYNFIRSQLNAAMADDDVKGIMLDLNSYGGEVAGCFELCADIRAARETKTIVAMVDSNAYSAGYAIASSASKIVVTPSGGVGSVGVVAAHMDMSQMLDKWGIKVTLIYEAEHKVDGNPYEPLPDEVKADIKKGIHKSYESFVSLVATNRGMDPQKVRDTKSRTYRADDALALGLIDAIASPIEAASAFLDELSGSTSQLRQGASMSTATTEPGAQNTTQAKTAEQAASEARIAERARVAGITGCDEAKGREALANHFAMNTDMSVADAKAALAVAPKAEAAPPKATGNTFEQFMNGDKHPKVGADADHAAEGSGVANPVAAILQAQSQATGIKLETR